MNGMKQLLKINEQLDALIEKRNAEAAKLKNEIEEDNETIEAQKPLLKAAIDAGNFEGFKRAKAEQEESQFLLEMHQSRLDTLEAGALMPEVEYDEIAEAIRSDARQMEEKAGREIAKLAKEMQRAGDEYKEYADFANAVLMKLQSEVARVKTPDAYKFSLAPSPIPHWGSSGTRDPNFGRYSGK